jgi:hypothetical protein
MKSPTSVRKVALMIATVRNTSLAERGFTMPRILRSPRSKLFRLENVSVPKKTDGARRAAPAFENLHNSGLMHRSKQRLYSITSSARVGRQLNSTPSLRTVSACARSPVIVANACSSASNPRASAGTSVNPSGPAASRVDFRRSRLGAKSGAARPTVGGKTAQISKG